MSYRNGFKSSFEAGESLTDVVTKLEDRIEQLEQYMNWDEELRKQSPALQDLYEKFQATKRLIT